MAVTWLHISDFHLSDGAPYDQVVILRALVSSVKRFREEGHVPDLIFATGDIAQQGKAKEYESATKFFDDLLEAAALNRDRLFIVPGNHDVDRKMGTGLVRTLDSNEDAYEYFDHETPTPHLTQKFHAFAEWYNLFFRNIRTFPDNSTCSPVDVVTIRDSRIAVLPLNSALFCIDDHDHQNLFIGRRCLDAAKKPLAAADITVALIHHPLNWLSPLEQSSIESALEESVDLLLQGHFHQTSAKGIVSANGGYLKLAAGASYQTRNCSNSAMYATFESNQVTIFPIRYEDKPQERWTLDTSLFSSPSHTTSFSIQGRMNKGDGVLVNRTPVKPDQLHAKEAERYQSMLKEELGYIRMLGLPGVESVKVNLNDDTFVPLRLSDRHDYGNPFAGKSAYEGNEHILHSDEIMKPGFHAHEGNEHILNPDEIMKQAFQDRRGRRMLLVIGDPGSGKTTLLKYYALCAFEDSNRLGFTTPVNVFYLPLRDLLRDKEGHYRDSLSANLANWAGMHHQTIETRIFEEWLQSGTSLVLLDGLDEISNTTERKEVCHWIDNAWAGFSKARFVVTSRLTGYNKEEGIELEVDYERADVQDFTQQQQERFLRNWFTAAFLTEPCTKGVEEASWQKTQKAEAEKRTTTIVAHLNVEKNKGLRQLAAIPMMLQIMAILWKDRDYMPESRVELYESALNYLLEFRDKRRGIKPLLSAIDARQVLAPVSLWMQDTLKKDEVSRADLYAEMQKWLDTLNTLRTSSTAEVFCDYLVKRAGLLAETGSKEYLFRHKSFREYLAGVQLKDVRPYEQLGKLVSHFGEDWWAEPIRFFISSVDANLFDAFMEKLFNASQSETFTTKQQLLLQTIIEEAQGQKIDSLCKKLIDPETTASRQRVILDCLKAIRKPAALPTLEQFRAQKLDKKESDIFSRTEEVIIALGGKALDHAPENSDSGKRSSIRNPNEHNAEYILIQGGSYIYSMTEQEVYVNDLYVAKYPVTNKLYRSFIAFLQAKGSKEVSFRTGLQTIAEKNKWGEGFSAYVKEGQCDLATLFRSRYDEDRKFDGDDQPVVGITWYAAQAYAFWLSQLEGKTESYRLPTDIEREWAAGGRQGMSGKKVRKYPWIDKKGESSPKLLNYGYVVGQTTPVNRYPEGATPEGLYDMAGNVWEWCSDLVGSIRVNRGGSWNRYEGCRSAYRSGDHPVSRGSGLGFRLVFVP